MSENKEVLSWREVVRKRPAMYIGSLSCHGFLGLLKMIFENVFLSTECDGFEINFDKKLGGKIRFNNLKKAIKDSINEDLKIGSFECAILNALSNKYEFTLFDKDNNTIFSQSYVKGILKKGKVQEKTVFGNWFEIKFKLDKTIWDFEEINVHYFADEIKNSAFLFKDKTFEIRYFVKNKQSKIIYYFENGLFDQIEIEKHKGWGSFLFDTLIEKDFGDFSIETAFAFRKYQIDEPFLKSYVNYRHTHEEGTHVKSIIKGLTKSISDYYKKHKPNEKYQLEDKLLRNTLVASVHLKIQQPLYYGPTKNKLVSPEIITPISDYVAEIFTQKLENDLESAKDLIHRFRVWER